MKTTGADEPDLDLSDGRYVARIFYAKEYEARPTLGKKGRMSLGFKIPTPAGQATRWGSWGVDQSWAKKMFVDVFGEGEDGELTAERMLNEVVEVTLTTKEGRDQEVGRISSTAETLPRPAPKAGAKPPARPATKPATKPVQADDAW